MKKYLFLIFTLYNLTAFSQKSGDAKLDKRINDYMALNIKLDFVNIMEYMHPKLFTIAPKEAILQSFKQVYDNEDMKISIDTLYTTKISAAKNFGKADYRKIDYFMTMTLAFTDSSFDFDDEFIGIMKESLNSGFPGKKISADKEKMSFTISGNEVMFAIKDNGAVEWMFLGVDKTKPELQKMLYPEDVRKFFSIL